MTRRRRLMWVALGLTVLLLATAVPAGRVWRDRSPAAAVYFVPHQDDESISMGALVASDTRAGREVHLVLLGDGTGSQARAALCRTEQLCLTPQGQGRARDREFVNAARILGVAEQNVHFARSRENTLQPEQAAGLMEPWLARFGDGASYTTMSWLDGHTDHRAAALALDEQCRTRALGHCRFTISPLYREATADSVPISGVARADRIAPTQPERHNHGDDTRLMVEAAASYRDVDHERGLYGLGGLYSVASQISAVEAQPGVEWHPDSSHLADEDARRASLAWTPGRLNGSPAGFVSPLWAQRQDGSLSAERIDLVDVPGQRVVTHEVRNCPDDGRARATWSTASIDTDGDTITDLLQVGTDGKLSVSRGDAARPCFGRPARVPVDVTGADLFAAAPVESGGFQLLVSRPWTGRLTLYRVGSDARTVEEVELGMRRGDATSLGLLPDRDGDGLPEVLSTGDAALVLRHSASPRDVVELPAAPKGSRILAVGDYDGFLGAADILLRKDDRTLLLRGGFAASDQAPGHVAITLPLPAGATSWMG